MGLPKLDKDKPYIYDYYEESMAMKSLCPKEEKRDGVARLNNDLTLLCSFVSCSCCNINRPSCFLFPFSNIGCFWTLALITVVIFSLPSHLPTEAETVRIPFGHMS
jgi:hypothetical protein